MRVAGSMTEVPGPNGVTTWIRRLAEVAEVAGKISGGSLATILLGLVISAWFGWINSPFSTLPRAMELHDGRMVSMGDTRLRLDQEMLETLATMSKEMARSNNAYRVRICSEIADAAVRRRCLDS